MSSTLNIPKEAKGLRLCKMVGDQLHLSEPVIFTRGAKAVETILRRAAISGKVGPIGETGDYWADILTDPNNWIDTVALDRESWNSLKNHWMRCKMESFE